MFARLIHGAAQLWSTGPFSPIFSHNMSVKIQMQYHESVPSTVVIGPRKTPLEDFTAQKDADNFKSVDSD